MSPIINYYGFEAEHYCYRIQGDCVRGIDMVNFQKEVTDWLFDTTEGKWYMGNEWPYSTYPEIMPFDPNKKDVFLLFETLEDVVLFEETFSVQGILVSDLRKSKFF
jgi:hypothetical protein